jgi:hypothetical protein
MDSENIVENSEDERYRSMEKIQGTVQNTVRAWSTGDIQTPDGFVNLIRAVKLGSLSGVRKQ